MFVYQIDLYQLRVIKTPQLLIPQINTGMHIQHPSQHHTWHPQ